ncbi:predicted protein [Botrytis cinerea T4]|uniref:Uncharacterized protein n=1 Tax=Botryotinia fuckeliana (strain T4) TaxID=999810 RepID=G2XR02_BOTF4|nr:predicted protein [Botrytis cinerea T4]
MERLVQQYLSTRDIAEPIEFEKTFSAYPADLQTKPIIQHSSERSSLSIPKCKFERRNDNTR